MEGVTLDALAKELAEMTGDVLERRVASALGPGLPDPEHLPLTGNDRPAWGRAGRALRTWLAEHTPEGEDDAGAEDRAATWRRLRVLRGIELHVHENHPLSQMGDRDADLADAVRLAVTRIMGMTPEQTISNAPPPRADTEPEPRSH
jgi:hypothetical protein